MRRIAIALFGFLAICGIACAQMSWLSGFSVRPIDFERKAIEIGLQQGDVLEPELKPEEFEEVTIAQGSGRDGFDAIRVFSDRTGYSVFARSRGQKNEKVSILLSKAELAGLIKALNSDHVTQIQGSYSNGAYDGTQGFIEIKTDKGRRYCWLDNHFDPVSNSFEYCNRVIWPKIKGAKVQQTDVNRQEEYYRVFHPEKAEQDESPNSDSAVAPSK